jgi:GntR family transcriptional regulator
MPMVGLGGAMLQAQSAPQAEPLYEQVYRIFRSRILNGEWKSQSLLPGEVLLSQELGVSVGTVRKAMDQLAREDLIVRGRGRGTFVKNDGERQSLHGLRLLDAQGQGIIPTIQLVNAHVCEATEFEIRVLRLRSYLSTRTRVLKLDRRWVLGETLLGTETSSIDASRFPEIVQMMTSQVDALCSVYDDAVRARSDRAVWQFGTAATGVSAVANLDRTNCAASSSKMRVRRVSLDNRDVPIELSQFEFCLNQTLVQLTTCSVR